MQTIEYIKQLEERIANLERYSSGGSGYDGAGLLTAKIEGDGSKTHILLHNEQGDSGDIGSGEYTALDFLITDSNTNNPTNPQARIAMTAGDSADSGPTESSGELIFYTATGTDFNTNTLVEGMRLDSNGTLTLSQNAYAFGTIDANNGAGLKSFGGYVLKNITMENSNTRIKIDKAGLYHMHFNQLISTASTLYWQLNINGSTVYHSYTSGAVLYKDHYLSLTKYLSVNDYIEVNNSVAISNSWSGQHSGFGVYRIV